MSEAPRFDGRRVLVTGAGGFIGSHLAERLVSSGARVRALCRYDSVGSAGWLDGSNSRHEIEICYGDVRDARLVEECCRDVEVVFHLAALVAIPFSYRAPESFLETNARGTLNVLEAVRRRGCHRMVHASTSEVYGTPSELPIRETHALRAQSPYSASKVAADKLCEAYAASFATPAVVLRPFNTYGPRQSSRAVLPTILCQLLAGHEEIRLGNLTPRRDLTFVDDTVDGFLRAGAAPDLAPGEVIQLGTGRAFSVSELLDAACRVTGRSARPLRDPQRERPAGSEVEVLLSDPARARERLGWAPRTELAEGLRFTARWLEANLGRYDPDAYRD